jgi:hypothetical protein
VPNQFFVLKYQDGPTTSPILSQMPNALTRSLETVLSINLLDCSFLELSRYLFDKPFYFLRFVSRCLSLQARRDFPVHHLQQKYRLGPSRHLWEMRAVVRKISLSKAYWKQIQVEGFILEQKRPTWLLDHLWYH